MYSKIITRLNIGRLKLKFENDACSTGPPSGNLVDGLPLVVSNGGWEDCWPLKAKLCVAREAFFCHVLRILMSEFNEDLKEPSLGIKERSCVIGMFVIIMSAEHD